MPQNLQGALWALLAAAIFSGVSALAKLALLDFHVLQILFFRQLVVLSSALPQILRNFPGSLRTRKPGLHAVRLVGAFIALSCGIWAVALLPLTAAATLGFVRVFLVALLAVLFLHESMGRHRIAATLLGFLGVLVVLQPGAEDFAFLPALVPVLGAFGAAMAITAVRRLTRTESTATLLVYQSVFVGVLAGIPLFWLWETPDLPGLALLLSMGALATAGQWVGVRSLRLGEASVVGNMEYSKLLFAALLGFVLFQEIPSAATLAGAALIVGAAVYLLRREALARLP